ncbi:MAG: 30S ribosomal protein S16 [Nitrospirae bacterium CG18_big_fil_WC_8_21_14_2_50_70_55]|nr:30S ribosomal protein S16 [Deltaproteobacteria bacterium]OIP65118.1 MAG: 30S ribosomal protein S16 [Nitrospirae bacterium CG2_30_70_394]PIQ04214.1 MAG: 30S ribosomal protein S16 [Nitrospirae bacterium CG18_big_fil_WC_8_21_14_2_50_70_55]PIU79822.1 MAG: 30S ribosomal protein S16 [Nitrospirae bacterium CG06_land_8_20_14_3_00_70_43]PIW81882.1 MAG: 30S ribosomal protein S16 [Nitrospirae bacterium CG_4_8_14_3_um_filter_70_85]PIX82151.1 MAG: 30S ribosomal protein S16 [Nitrospirae bacterium CG_4_10
MAVVIRLARGGAKKAAFFRVVVADSRVRRDGRIVEQVGTFNPRLVEAGATLVVERIRHWLDQGAQPSAAVKSLLRKAKIVAGTPRGEAEAAPAE